jgi:hypothetical protein
MKSQFFSVGSKIPYHIVPKIAQEVTTIRHQFTSPNCVGYFDDVTKTYLAIASIKNAEWIGPEQ